jgi:hypothetical protein
MQEVRREQSRHILVSTRGYQYMLYLRDAALEGREIALPQVALVH